MISMTTSNSLLHKMRIVKRFHFHHTKAIALRQSTILMSFLLHKNLFLRSNMHTMEETMLSMIYRSRFARSEPIIHTRSKAILNFS